MKDLKFRTSWYPVTPMLLIVMCIILFVGMFFDPSRKSVLVVGIPTLVLLYGGFTIYHIKAKSLK